jgi:group I intron endonuclease
MSISGVYFIKNKVTNKCYVGSSINIYRRWTTHRRELARGKHHSAYLQNSYNKYGKDAFEFLLAESSFDTKEMAVLEAKWIDRLDAIKNGYNVNPFPYEIGLMPKSDEHKRKIGQAHKGRKLSEESKDKIRQKALGRKVGPMSEEQKKKISEIKKGKSTMTEEGKRKLAEYRRSLKGKITVSEEHKKAISDAAYKWHARKKQENCDF